MINFDMANYSPADLAAEFGLEDLTGTLYDIAEAVGVEAAINLCESFGGQAACIASSQSLYRLLKGRCITEDKGNNEHGINSWLKHITVDDFKGWQKRVADTVGVEASLKLSESFEGMTLYIPTNENLRRRLRRRKIWRAYYDEGLTIFECVKRFQVSRQTVHRIINKKLEEL